MSRSPARSAADHELVEAWGLVVEGYSSAMHRMSEDIEAASGLPAKSFEVLLRLARTPGRRLPLTELARSVSFSSSGFTRLADRLERDGLIGREPCPTDRRVTFAVLTDAGSVALDAALGAHIDGLRRYVLAPLGATGVQDLAAAMRRLRDAIDQPSP